LKSMDESSQIPVYNKDFPREIYIEETGAIESESSETTPRNFLLIKPHSQNAPRQMDGG